MKLRPKKNRKRIKNFRLHCGACGKGVPFDRKYLTEFFQQKIKGVKRWIVSFGYICPDCITTTKIILNYDHPLDKIIRKIDLYQIYNKNK